MIYELITRNILRQFGIGKRYNGYDYIIHAIGLSFFDERFLNCVTKVLYITIGENYDTSSICVERNIRKVIQIIWDNPDNVTLIEKIFGVMYTYTKPTNKEFLGLLYEYVKSYNIIEEILKINKIICPVSKEVCSVYVNIVDQLRSLS